LAKSEYQPFPDTQSEPLILRILFWSPAFWPEIGGVQFFGAQLLGALRDRGYTFCVVTRQYVPTLPAEDTFEDIAVRRFPFRTVLSSGKIDAVMDLRKKVSELKCDFAPDLIHVNSADETTFFHLATANACPAPTLLTLHGLGPERTNDEHSMVRQMLQAADWITCCSRSTLQEAEQIAPEIESVASVIHNARRIPEPVRDPRLPDKPGLLCLGRLSAEKGFDVVLTALAELTSRVAEARLAIAGDGPEREALTAQASALGLSRRVDFLGWVAPDQIPALIAAAAVVVVPSRWEGFGLAALEAALMARPVVASDVGGLREVVEDGVTGLLVPPESSDRLADAIEHLLTHPETAVKMGLAGRRRAVREFGWPQHVDAYDQLYRKLTAEAHAR